MATFSGPKAITTGLALCLDAANDKSTKLGRNLLPIENWTIGSGSATFFGQNGDGNSRLIDTNPWGVSDMIWQSLGNDATSDADGGWNTSLFPIDNTKTYRFSTWVNRKVLGNGSFYLGLRGYDSASSNVGVISRSGGAANTNPYFTSFGWSFNVNEWYLVVGHVWPTTSGSGAVHPNTGIYNLSGTKVSTPGDFVWQSSNTQALHRSYLYYSTDATTNQQWYQPRVDICDGSEPTIPELLQGAAGKQWRDLSGNSNHCTWNVPPIWYSAGYYTFDGSTDYGTIINNSTLNFSNEQTLIMVLRHTYTSGRKNPWNQAYGGYGTWTHEQGENISQYFGDAGANASPYIGVGSPTTPRGVWNVMAITRNTTQHKWFINGVLSGTTAHGYGSLATTAADILIGNGYAGYWQGDMAGVYAYTRALSDSEVFDHSKMLMIRHGI